MVYVPEFKVEFFKNVDEKVPAEAHNVGGGPQNAVVHAFVL